jgi:hypothetical protein
MDSKMLKIMAMSAARANDEGESIVRGIIAD